MSIYSENIIDHYQNPRNFKHIANCTGKAKINNVLCGDEITMFAVLRKKRVLDIGFIAKGCVISIASSSMLTEYCRGRLIKDLKKLDRKFIIKLLGIELSPSRLKCALLPLEALKKAIRE